MAGATVTARGEAVASARPDRGIWTLDVNALEASPDEALAIIAGQSKELETLLDQLGVAGDYRTTTGVTVREESDYVDGKQVHRGYRAQNVVTVGLEDHSLAGRMIEGAISRAKASVRGPAWWIAPDNPARIEACGRAAADARRKAQAYAEALGLTLGDVTEVREPSGGWAGEPRPFIRAMAAMEPGLDVDPALVDVTATVEVTFGLKG